MCARASMYVCVRMYLCLCVFVYACVGMSGCMCVCARLCVRAQVHYTGMYACARVGVCDLLTMK